MPTKGRRNAAASSHALKVGAQIPTSGENASPTPAAVPLKPLASAYVRMLLMKVTPTSGPIARRSTHHARDDTSSRYSLSSRCRNGPLRERKEDLFEIRRRRAMRRRHLGQFVERTLTAHAAAAQDRKST